jgi:hypothetical protein
MKYFGRRYFSNIPAVPILLVFMLGAAIFKITFNIEEKAESERFLHKEIMSVIDWGEDRQFEEKTENSEAVKVIYEALTKDPHLSENGKNIEISTINGEIVLRGMVISRDERIHVATVAQTAIGKEHRIRDELEVDE